MAFFSRFFPFFRKILIFFLIIFYLSLFVIIIPETISPVGFFGTNWHNHFDVHVHLSYFFNLISFTLIYVSLNYEDDPSKSLDEFSEIFISFYLIIVCFILAIWHYFLLLFLILFIIVFIKMMEKKYISRFPRLKKIYFSLKVMIGYLLFMFVLHISIPAICFVIRMYFI